MKYVIVTTEWCLSKGIKVPEYTRKSINNNKVVMHYEFIEPVLTDSDKIEVYEYDSKELANILRSPEWTMADIIR